jgi:hypothetical protein
MQTRTLESREPEVVVVIESGGIGQAIARQGSGRSAPQRREPRGCRYGNGGSGAPRHPPLGA